MVHMYPANGPDSDWTSSAERDLYWLFKAQLDDQFSIIHSAWWHSEDDFGRPEDGEADFIIVHPDYGVLVLEIKGGLIERRGRDWYQSTREGRNKRKLKSPAHQARKSAYVLLRMINRNPQLSISSYCPIGFSVWCPDTQLKIKGEDTFEGLKYFCLDESNKADVKESLLAIFRHFCRDRKPPVVSEEGVRDLLYIIEPSNEIRSSFAPSLKGDKPLSPILTPLQFAKLREMWRSERQLLIRGEAGTGKTVLAMEMATRLAMEGYKILLLVKSPHMATWLQGLIDADTRKTKPAFDLYDIQSIAHILAQKGGKLDHEIDTLDIDTASEQQELRRIFNLNIETLYHQDIDFFYDGVIVDDAEDFERPLSGEIQKLRRDRRNGFYFVFQDEGQRMTEDRHPPIFPGRPRIIDLTENWRNSDAIFALMKAFHPTLQRGTNFLAQPGSVLFLDDLTRLANHGTLSPQDPEALILALERLMGPICELSAEQILIITMRGQNASFWSSAENRRRALPFTLRWWERRDVPHLREGKIGIATINQAKGIEHEAVILVELEGLEVRPKRRIRDTLSYVGISRARQHLIVLGAREQIFPTA